MRKKIFSFSIVVIIASIASCTNLVGNGDKYDVSALKAEYSNYAEKDSMDRVNYDEFWMDGLLDDEQSGGNMYEQGLCCLSDWSLDIPEVRNSEDEFVSSSVDIFNTVAVLNAVYSDYEVWQRYKEGGKCLVDTESILSAIKGIKFDCISNMVLKQALADYRDSVVMYIENDSIISFGGTPLTFKERVLSTMEEQIGSAVIDSTQYISYAKYMYEVANDTVSKHIEAEIKNNPSVEKMFESLGEASNFDDQCKVVMGYSGYRGSYNIWTLHTMQAFMSGDLYSLQLVNVWRTWRCLIQGLYCGQKRDSVIANYLYNKYRKMVFAIIVRHIMQNPDDTVAKTAAKCIAVAPDVIRNGRSESNNDNVFEMMEMAPYFYGF